MKGIKTMTKYTVKAEILSSDERQDLVLDLECYFIVDESDYGNGHYLNIVGEGFKKYLDIRYDKDFSRNNKLSYLASYFDNYWSGENGAYKLKTIEIKLIEERT